MLIVFKLHFQLMLTNSLMLKKMCYQIFEHIKWLFLFFTYKWFITDARLF